jgi:hypothetical protein
MDVFSGGSHPLQRIGARTRMPMCLALCWREVGAGGNRSEKGYGQGESILWTTKHRDAQGIADLPQHRLVGERSEKGCGLGESNLHKTKEAGREEKETRHIDAFGLPLVSCVVRDPRKDPARKNQICKRFVFYQKEE